MNKQHNFNSSRVEFELIGKIADRALALAHNHGLRYDAKPTVVMDVTAAHNSCPIDLPKLLAADDATFGHDVFGIRRHIDRETGAPFRYMREEYRPQKRDASLVNSWMFLIPFGLICIGVLLARAFGAL